MYILYLYAYLLEIKNKNWTIIILNIFYTISLIYCVGTHKLKMKIVSLIGFVQNIFFLFFNIKINNTRILKCIGT